MDKRDAEFLGDVFLAKAIKIQIPLMMLVFTDIATRLCKENEFEFDKNR
jgi:hypothetical protein